MVFGTFSRLTLSSPLSFSAASSSICGGKVQYADDRGCLDSGAAVGVVVALLMPRLTQVLLTLHQSFKEQNQRDVVGPTKFLRYILHLVWPMV